MERTNEFKEILDENDDKKRSWIEMNCFFHYTICHPRKNMILKMNERKHTLTISMGRKNTNEKARNNMKESLRFSK